MSKRIIESGVPFDIVRDEGGVRLRAGRPEFSGAAELINESIAGTAGYRDWPERVARGEERIDFPAFSFLIKVASAQAPERAVKAWQSYTGQKLAGEVWHVNLDRGYQVAPESWVPSSFLVRLYERARQERLGSEPVWLFRFRPLFWKPSPHEEARVRAMEQRARDANGPAGVDGLVAELQDLGLFDHHFAAERRAALEAWGAERLLEMQREGLALGEYLFSPEHRAVAAPPEYPRAVERSPIALAVFLSPDTPWPETGRHAWLAERLREARAAAGDATRGAYRIEALPTPEGPRIGSIAERS